jgi:DNA-binding NarL/FixJ family response regulator
MTDDKTSISLLVVDDHPLMLSGICALIDAEPDLTVACRALDGAQALDKLHQGCLPDVALLDLQLPDMSGIDLMGHIRALSPATRMIVLTTFDGDAQVLRAVKAGAQGYLLKSMHGDEIAEAIRKVHNGRRHIPAEIAIRLAEYVGDAALTRRELDVLALMAKGQSNVEIGISLGVSMETAKSHVSSILGKLGVKDRTLAVRIALRRGILME